MFVPEGKTGYKVYWLDREGIKHQLFTNGLDQETALNSAIDYIRNYLILESFTIVGLDVLRTNGWKAILMERIICKGRS